ncbi:MAG TPA: 30S ribosomal protein S15 [Candidatus Bathyarchaeia archaeon]|nr:30S ribosomal protein S15 [Candidatus Bathyarchaeia archaeon]
MARMHARRKGVSGSTRPLKTTVPLTMTSEELQKVIVELRNSGLSSSQIGIVLRDTYGVPSVKSATKKSLTELLRDNGVAPELPEDLFNLITKALKLRDHLEENKKDLHNKRALQLTESKIRRLVTYYKSRGVLPGEWSYRLDTVEMLISR